MNVYDIALDFVLQSVGNKSIVDKTQHNIGQFFKHIRNSIMALGDDIFCKDFKDKEECKKRQLHWPWDMYADTLYKVTDVTSAKKAIKMIVQQGEGASPQDPTYLKSNELAHFYRFGENLPACTTSFQSASMNMATKEGLSSSFPRGCGQ